MAQEKEGPVIDVQETISKVEKYIQENKKSLSIITGAIVVLVGGYFAWTKLYLAPLEEEAREQMFMAEKYFEQDSLDKAMQGDGQFPGFLEIVDKYSITQAGNLARLYLGLCYLYKGQYEEAITHLKQYDGEDVILHPISIGAIGDAYAELGKLEEAVTYYLKAANANENDFTSPIYLTKAAGILESQGKYKEALVLYEQIKTDFPESREAREIEKYIVRARTLAGNK